GRLRFTQVHANRPLIRTLQEHPLTVDGEDPVAHLDASEPDRSAAHVARARVRGHLDLDVVTRLITECPRPPQLWVRHPDCPFEPVLTRCELFLADQLDDVSSAV